MLKIYFPHTSLKITELRLQTHLPGAYELKWMGTCFPGISELIWFSIPRLPQCHIISEIVVFNVNYDPARKRLNTNRRFHQIRYQIAIENIQRTTSLIWFDMTNFTNLWNPSQAPLTNSKQPTTLYLLNKSQSLNGEDKQVTRTWAIYFWTRKVLIRNVLSSLRLSIRQPPLSRPDDESVGLTRFPFSVYMTSLSIKTASYGPVSVRFWPSSGTWYAYMAIGHVAIMC